MKNKKGFTLIELLAVIVVLATIALIVTPIVTKTIKNAKKGSAEIAAQNYIRAVELAISNSELNRKAIPNGSYSIDSDGNLIGTGLPNGKLEVDANGDRPTGGTVVIKDGQVTNDSTITVGGYDVSYDLNSKSYIAIPADKSPQPVPSKSCFKSKSCSYSGGTVGTKFKFDPVNYKKCTSGDTCYNWLIIANSTGNENSFEAMMTDSKFSSGWGTVNGPTLIMSKLSEITSNWSKGLIRDDSYSSTIKVVTNFGASDCSYYGASGCQTTTKSYTSDFSGLKARTITKDEIDYTTCEPDGMGGCSNNKYELTLTVSTTNSGYDGYITGTNFSHPNCDTLMSSQENCLAETTYRVLRPVITLPNSILDN